MCVTRSPIPRTHHGRRRQHPRHRPPLAARRITNEARSADEQWGHRGFTVVTIITLVFVPFLTHHDWVWRLVGQTKQTQIEQCVANQPCPAHRVVVTVERQPIPSGGRGGGEPRPPRCPSRAPGRAPSTSATS